MVNVWIGQLIRILVSPQRMRIMIYAGTIRPVVSARIILPVAGVIWVVQVVLVNVMKEAPVDP